MNNPNVSEEQYIGGVRCATILRLVYLRHQQGKPIDPELIALIPGALRMAHYEPLSTGFSDLTISGMIEVMTDRYNKPLTERKVEDE